MKKLLVAGACVILMAAAMIAAMPAAMPAGAQNAGSAASTVFFTAIDDLPLMPGMTEQADAVVFDQPDGRVVEVMATVPLGTGSAGISAFYDQTLPQLGWQKDGANSYVRDKERLSITIGNVMGGPLPVRFSIKPR